MRCLRSRRDRWGRLLSDCEADVVFLPYEESFLSKWLSRDLQMADMIPCPAIYVPPAPSIPVWNLERIGDS